MEQASYLELTEKEHLKISLTIFEITSLRKITKSSHVILIFFMPADKVSNTLSFSELVLTPLPKNPDWQVLGLIYYCISCFSYGKGGEIRNKLHENIMSYKGWILRKINKTQQFFFSSSLT